MSPGRMLLAVPGLHTRCHPSQDLGPSVKLYTCKAPEAHRRDWKHQTAPHGDARGRPSTHSVCSAVFRSTVRERRTLKNPGQVCLPYRALWTSQVSADYSPGMSIIPPPVAYEVKGKLAKFSQQAFSSTLLNPRPPNGNNLLNCKLRIPIRDWQWRSLSGKQREVSVGLWQCWHTRGPQGVCLLWAEGPRLSAPRGPTNSISPMKGEWGWQQQSQMQGGR